MDRSEDTGRTQEVDPVLAEKEAFKAKLRTLNFGHVPGGNRQQSGWDKDAFRSQFGSEEAIKEATLEATEGIGHLRWDGGDAYKRDRVLGTYEKLTPKDYDRLMYGSKKNKEESV